MRATTLFQLATQQCCVASCSNFLLVLLHVNELPKIAIYRRLLNPKVTTRYFGNFTVIEYILYYSAYLCSRVQDKLKSARAKTVSCCALSHTALKRYLHVENSREKGSHADC